MKAKQKAGANAPVFYLAFIVLTGDTLALHSAAQGAAEDNVSRFRAGGMRSFDRKGSLTNCRSATRQLGEYRVSRLCRLISIILQAKQGSHGSAAVAPVTRAGRDSDK